MLAFLPSFFHFIAFIAGIVAKNCILLFHKEEKGDRRIFLLVLIVSMVAFLLPLSPDIQLIGGKWALYLISVTFFFYISFARRLLPIIHEGALLIWNIVGLYIYFADYGYEQNTFLLIAIPSFIVLILNFFPIRVNRFIRHLLYTWYVILFFFFVWTLYFSSGILTVLAKQTPFELFMSGMVIAAVISHIYYIVLTAILLLINIRTVSGVRQALETIETAFGSPFTNEQSYLPGMLVSIPLVVLYLLFEAKQSFFDHQTYLMIAVMSFPILFQSLNRATLSGVNQVKSLIGMQ